MFTFNEVPNVVFNMLFKALYPLKTDWTFTEEEDQDVKFVGKLHETCTSNISVEVMGRLIGCGYKNLVESKNIELLRIKQLTERYLNKDLYFSPHTTHQGMKEFSLI